MACGPHVLNLFEAARPRWITCVSPSRSTTRRTPPTVSHAQGIAPEVEDDRVHFLDPDGYKLQVGGPNAGGQRAETRPGL